MTDPTGRSFLSYRRSRLAEARLLIAAQHDVGIPTWQDLRNLGEEPTAEALRRVLEEPETASGLLWLTREVEGSPILLRLEVPELLARVRRDDGFFVVPVLAGGLEYGDLGGPSGVLRDALTPEELATWNVRKAGADPIAPGDAAEVAEWVLRRRLQTLTARLPPEEPLRICLRTREGAPVPPAGTALHLDWTERFPGRMATQESWEARLLPALRTVRRALADEAPRREIVAFGYPSLSAATALGAAFVLTGGRALAWEQRSESQTVELWAGAGERQASGFDCTLKDMDVGADDLAVLLSVSDNARPAFVASRKDLPRFRAQLDISKEGGLRQTLTPGLARGLAGEIRDALRAARNRLGRLGTIHLFQAVPAGLAVLLGQHLNTLGPVQTYEYLSIDGTGRYRPAARLHPSQ